MYSTTEHQQSTGMARSAARGTFTAFGARHVQGVAVSRWIAAVCFVIAGVLLLVFGHWWGALFFVAAGLNGSLAYLVPRWNRRPDTPSNARLSA
jgi:membrane protein implicated in regulation of membrane protease activity